MFILATSCLVFALFITLWHLLSRSHSASLIAFPTAGEARCAELACDGMERGPICVAVFGALVWFIVGLYLITCLALLYSVCCKSSSCYAAKTLPTSQLSDNETERDQRGWSVDIVPP
ncbi:hypothetical protein FKM82_000914 [Ascaphus truei]